jgi:hypothetical protein
MAENNKPTIEEQVASLAAALEEQKKISADQEKTIASLKGSVTEIKVVKEAEKLAIPKKGVKVKGKTYKFAAAHFHFDGKYVIADDAALDNELLENIVSIEGQGILVEQH